MLYRQSIPKPSIYLTMDGSHFCYYTILKTERVSLYSIRYSALSYIFRTLFDRKIASTIFALLYLGF